MTDNVIDNTESDEDDQDPALVTVPSAELGDTVFVDTNRDGIQDPDEAGVPDVSVTLLDGEGNTVGAATTDAQGMYLFTDLAPGDYQVRFETATIPEGTRVTLTDQGSDDAADSDADTVTGLTPVVTLVAGESNLTIDMGVIVEEHDLTLLKSVKSRTGNTVVWSIAVANQGPDAAPAPLTLTDDLPAALTFVSAASTDRASETSCTQAGQLITCILGSDLAANESWTVEITTTVSGTAAVTNTADVRSRDGQQGEQILGNNAGQAELAATSTPGVIPFTGSNSGLLVLLGLLLMGGGVGILLNERRRSALR